MKTQSQVDLIPHYKLHIEDITECKESEDGNNWLLEIGNQRTLDVNFVWLQGEITEIHEDFVTLNDTTGCCRIMASSAIQSSNSWLSPGAYCSVLGNIQEGGNEPTIVAMKMTSILNNSPLRRMWKLEVQELKLVLSGLAIPSVNEEQYLDSP